MKNITHIATGASYQVEPEKAEAMIASGNYESSRAFKVEQKAAQDAAESSAEDVETATDKTAQNKSAEKSAAKADGKKAEK